LNNYEGIFIARPTLTDEANQKLLTLIEGEISKNGGKIENVEKWGKKSLAYPISKGKEGFYYKIDFKIAPEKVSDLKNTYKLSEDILRLIIVKKG